MTTLTLEKQVEKILPMLCAPDCEGRCLLCPRQVVGDLQHEMERLRKLLAELLDAADASDARKSLFVGGELRDRVRRELHG